MIGLDTNILIRYLTQDDPVQSPKAISLIEDELTEEAPGFVSIVTLAETVWVLTRTFGLSDEEVVADLRLMLSADALVLEHEREVFTAMTVLQQKQGKFADALVAALSLKAGCSHTLTFDRKASRLLGFQLLS